MNKSEYKISILLPTRGRTDALSRSIISLFNRAVDIPSLQLMLGFDSDDNIGMDHFNQSVKPWLDDKGVDYTALVFEPMGYHKLNEYVNSLALASDADWVFFWNDDALMETTGWDKIIASYTGQFKLLSVHTHKDHPYSIFPIVPRAWLDTLGYLSCHGLNDAWLSQQAYMLDIYERIPVWVTHDRADLTGNNKDATFADRIMLEGNPHDPRDFHHHSMGLRRIEDCRKLAEYMATQGLDLSWWNSVMSLKQDPWTKLHENDINNQMRSWKVQLKPF